jgi:hypothetical protein
MDSRNLFDCPISLQPMRHPVVASDGQCYEASALLRYFDECGLISPLTRQPITSCQYARVLVDIIDKTVELEDRFESYQVAPVLSALQQHIDQAAQPRMITALSALPKTRLAQSLLFTIGAYAVLRLFNSFVIALFEDASQCDASHEHDLNHSVVVCLSMLLFALDLSVRSRFESGIGLLGLFSRSLANEAIRSLPEQARIEMSFDFPNGV